MRRAEDVLRSLSRYLSLSLGPEWTLALAAGEGDFARPFCRVTPSSAISTVAHGAHHVEMRRSFAAVCFPDVMADEQAAAIEASGVEDALVRAFAGAGAFTPAYSSRSGRGTRCAYRSTPTWACR